MWIPRLFLHVYVQFRAHCHCNFSDILYMIYLAGAKTPGISHGNFHGGMSWISELGLPWPSRKFVDLPMKNGWIFPWWKVAVYQRVSRVSLHFPMVFLWFCSYVMTIVQSPKTPNSHMSHPVGFTLCHLHPKSSCGLAPVSHPPSW